MTKLTSDFVKRRWLEFRHGYSGYLVFALNFSVFTTTGYLVFKIEFPDVPIFIFAVLVGIIVVPLAIIIGNNHVKKQFPTDFVVQTENNIYTYKLVPNSKEELFFKMMLLQAETLLSILQKSDDKDKKLIAELNESIVKFNKILQGVSSKQI